MSKIVAFFEEHVEKIVLGTAGILCLLLLILRVIISPNYVEFDGKKFSASRIDFHISQSEQAKSLSDKLNQSPQEPEPYIPRIREFSSLFNSAIRDIDVGLNPMIPPPIQNDIRLSIMTYNIPRFIGEVNDVAIEHIRAVAYVPAGEIDDQTGYTQTEAAPNDIDLVTVEAKFDVAGLFERFYECFAGAGVREDWRDPCLAEPVFAAVQLQRQEQLDDGSWSDWQIVPRTKIDSGRRMFEVIEDVAELPPGGPKVRILQYDKPEVQIALLQPEVYNIASAKEEWFPPSLHKEFVEQRRAEESEAKLEAIEKAKEERERERETTTTDERRTRRRSGESGGMYGEYDTGGRSSSRYGRETRTRGSTNSRSDRRTSNRGRTIGTTRGRDSRETDRTRSGTTREISKKEPKKDFYNEFSQISITPQTYSDKIRETILFWAHDDTVKPKKSYRYRIRIGFFNPIAGTGQFSEQDKLWSNKVILWSEFSDVTDKVYIPGRLYFFANDVQEAAKNVTVQVCKYVLGYWYSENFWVKQGEVIGKVKGVELKPEEKEKGLTVPDKIDYGTGAVLVDVVPVNDWTGSSRLSARVYYDMLHSFDGMHIEHMPVKARYWPRELQAAFGEIQRSQKQSKEPLRDWANRVSVRTQRITEVDSPEYDEYDFGD